MSRKHRSWSRGALTGSWGSAGLGRGISRLFGAAARTRHSRRVWLAATLAAQGILLGAGWLLMVQQVRSSVAEAYRPGADPELVTASMGGLTWVLAAMGGVVLLSTGFITARLMQRHDAELETVNLKLEEEVGKRVRQGLRTRDALITGLAKLADFRDNETGEHLDRIAEYSVLLARELKQQWPQLDEQWIATLRVASTMHDIGKVGVPDAVLLKPGRFTPQERKVMERHPLIGTETLIAVRERMGSDALVEMALRVALYHHERWDGGGYPTGMAGDKIPLEARIVALADVYDALTSRRVYKEAMPHPMVVELIREASGTHFDPAIVQAFLHTAGQFDAARVRLQPREPDAAPMPEIRTTPRANTIGDRST